MENQDKNQNQNQGMGGQTASAGQGSSQDNGQGGNQGSSQSGAQGNTQGNAQSSAQSSVQSNTQGNAQGNAQNNAQGNANASASSGTTGADDLLTLMDQSGKTCAVGQWLRCLRKPGLSVQYTLTKRHVADMDSEAAGQSGVSSACGSAPLKGANADVMNLQGGFTIRYLDLAAGLLLLTAVGCVVKGLCCLKKMM